MQPVFGENSIWNDWIAVSKQAAHDCTLIRYMGSWFTHETKADGSEWVKFHSKYGFANPKPGTEHQAVGRASIYAYVFGHCMPAASLDPARLARCLLRETVLGTMLIWENLYKPSRWLASGWWSCVNKVNLYEYKPELVPAGAHPNLGLREYLPGPAQEPPTNVWGKFFQQS